MINIDIGYFVQELIISILGLTIALYANSIIENIKDRKTYKLMLETINSEAESNKKILHDSFLKYFGDGVVLRGFSMEKAKQYLGNTIFIEHAEKSDIEILSTYIRELSLANSYREYNERNDLYNKEWIGSENYLLLFKVWNDNLRNCYEYIDKVRQLGVTQLPIYHQCNISFTEFHNIAYMLQIKNLCNNKIVRWTGRVRDITPDNVIVDIIPNLDYKNAKDVYYYYTENFHNGVEYLYPSISIDKMKTSTISLFLGEDHKSELLPLSKGDIITFEGINPRVSSYDASFSLSIKMSNGKIIENTGKKYMMYIGMKIKEKNQN